MPLFNKEYPDAFGAHRASMFSVAGPASYTQYTAPATGGQVVAVEPNAGMKVADYVWGGVTRDGLHRVEVVAYEPASIRGVTVPRAQIRLKWYVVATGAEVAGAVNLSTKTVDLFAIGPK
jgi:hypothetical protein